MSLYRAVRLLTPLRAAVRSPALSAARLPAPVLRGAFVRGFAAQAEGMSTEPPPEEDLNAEKKAGQSASQQNAAPESETPEAKVARLTARVAELEAAVKDTNAARLRTLAEMENVRRIARNDVDKAKEYALQSFSKKLLLAVDNLHMAVTAVPKESLGENKVFVTLFDGVAAVERILLKVLSEEGVKQFGVAGDKFDPNRFEAVMMQPAAEAAQVPNTVAHVLKTGFLFKDRTLRPAQVVVYVKPEAAAAAQEAQSKVGDSTRTL